MAEDENNTQAASSAQGGADQPEGPQFARVTSVEHIEPGGQISRVGFEILHQ